MTEVNMQLGSLANPERFRSPASIPDGSSNIFSRHLERMILIRSVEETIGDLVATGEVRCPCHLAIGQEAIPVGLATNLLPGDRVFGAHRSHGYYLALGGTPESLLAEVLGRARGCSNGLGGSMHLREPSIGLIGTVPIVAATIPIAVGAALAARMDGEAAAAVAVFGDGATEEGVFHESLNLAQVLGCPVLFVCENNLFSSHLHISLRQPYDSVGRFGAVHGMPTLVVDGNDVAAVEAASAELLETVRNGHPAFLEAVTYRWRGHVGHREDADVGVGRSGELAHWKERCPIARVAKGLINGGALTERGLAHMNARIAEEVQDALFLARTSPYPPDSYVEDAVFPTSSGLL